MAGTIRRFSGRLTIAAVGFILVMLAARTPFYQFFERKTLDYRFCARDYFVKPGGVRPVVIVGIDAGTLERFRSPVIFWNAEFSELIDAIVRGGAKTVGFDVLHLAAIDTDLCRIDQDRLLESISKSRRTVLPYKLQNNESTGGVDIRFPIYLMDVLRNDLGFEPSTASKLKLNAKLSILSALEDYKKVGFGYANLSPDPDGTIREMMLARGYGGNPLFSLPFSIYMKYEGIDPGKIAAHTSRIVAGRTRIPLRHGRMMINYTGYPGSYPHLSMADVLDRRNDADFLTREFEGKIALIGAYDVDFADFSPTPHYAVKAGKTQNMFGVEIIANTLDTIINRRFIRREPVLFRWLIIFAAAALSIFLLSKMTLWRGLIALGALMAAYAAAAMFAFSKYNLWLELAEVEIALPFTFLLGYVYNTFVIDRDRNFIRKVLASYLDQRIVDQLAKSGDASILRGRRKEVTVMFSDIRGFTPLSKKLEPEQVVDVLNHYLPVMSGIVFESEGMVDKYIGDAIMAVWNAPNDVEDHRFRACDAALKMHEAMAEVNSRLDEHGIDVGGGLRFGVGINTGEVVVGNIGCERKCDYTCIGDAVNLASRLESLNKDYKTGIIISESTYCGIEDRVEVRELDIVQVRGREAPVRIYELLSIKG